MRTWAIRVLEWPSIEHIGGKNPWRLTKPLVVCINARFYTVPEGYCTDLASVPRIPFVYARYGNTATIPAILHDAMYDGCLGDDFTRKEADEIFLAMMQMLNDPTGHLRRRVMYRAVRLFGWRGWRRDTTWKCKHG